MAGFQAILFGRFWVIPEDEACRQGFSSGAKALMTGHPLFGDLLKRGVAFYRDVPAHTAILHPGSAPEWLVTRWLEDLRKGAGKKSGAKTGEKKAKTNPPVVEKIGVDLKRMQASAAATVEELIALLLAIEDPAKPSEDDEDAGVVY